MDQLRILLRNDLKNRLQILTLSETWVKRDLSGGELDISGYKLFRKDRDGGNGGVAAYVRDVILVTRRDDLEIDSVEGLWLEIGSCPSVPVHGGIPIVFISIHGVVTQFVNVSFLCVPVHEDTTRNCCPKIEKFSSWNFLQT